jgi:hypothetical protein
LMRQSALWVSAWWTDGSPDYNRHMAANTPMRLGLFLSVKGRHNVLMPAHVATSPSAASGLLTCCTLPTTP